MLYVILNLLLSNSSENAFACKKYQKENAIDIITQYISTLKTFKPGLHACVGIENTNEILQELLRTRLPENIAQAKRFIQKVRENPHPSGMFCFSDNDLAVLRTFARKQLDPAEFLNQKSKQKIFQALECKIKEATAFRRLLFKYIDENAFSKQPEEFFALFGHGQTDVTINAIIILEELNKNRDDGIEAMEKCDFSKLEQICNGLDPQKLIHKLYRMQVLKKISDQISEVQDYLNKLMGRLIKATAEVEDWDNKKLANSVGQCRLVKMLLESQRCELEKMPLQYFTLVNQEIELEKSSNHLAFLPFNA